MTEQDINKAFAANLTRLLNLRGLSQVDVANALNVSESAVSLWCSGKTTPRMSKVDKLCELLNCSRASLVENEPPDGYYERAHPIYKTLVQMSPEQLDRLQEYAEFLLKR